MGVAVRSTASARCRGVGRGSEGRSLPRRVQRASIAAARRLWITHVRSRAKAGERFGANADPPYGRRLSATVLAGRRAGPCRPVTGRANADDAFQLPRRAAVGLFGSAAQSAPLHARLPCRLPVWTAAYAAFGWAPMTCEWPDCETRATGLGLASA